MCRTSKRFPVETSPVVHKTSTLERGDKRHGAGVEQCRVERSLHPLEIGATFTTRRIILLFTLLILHVPSAFDNRLLVTE